MAHMQITVGLRRKACNNALNLTTGEVILNDFGNEIVAVWSCVCHNHPFLSSTGKLTARRLFRADIPAIVLRRCQAAKKAVLYALNPIKGYTIQ